MAVYKNREEMIDILSATLARAFSDEEFARKIRAAALTLRYNYFDPECSLLVDAARDPIEWGFDREAVEANIEFRFSGDTAHEFFLGRLNVPLALATRRVLFKGQVSKALKLLPIVKPLYAAYRAVLAEKGRTDLLSETPPKARRAAKRGFFSGIFPRPTGVDYAAAERYGPGAVVCRGAEQPAPARRYAPPEPGPELDKQMLETMLLIRAFEEHLAVAFGRGELPTFAVHLSIGQEAVAAGLLALRGDDLLNTTHRGHGHMIAKGADVRAMMAELYAKADGTCKGKGGSMHIIDPSVGIMGSNGIVGAGIVLGAGAGLAAKMLGDGRVSVAMFGDGATNQGMFHEGLNFAAVKKLPAVFIIENNGYGEFTPLAEHSGITELFRRAESYGIEGRRVDGNDARAVFAEVSRAAAKARSGGGPTLLEAVTHRWRGHMEGDEETYRTAEEKSDIIKKCPIARLRGELEREGILGNDEFDAMKRRAEQTIADAVTAAVAAPFPSPEELFTDVYAPDHAECCEGEMFPSGATVDATVSQAINETLAAEMRRDPAVFLIGEDVALGGYMSVTVGLVEEFGRDRVIDTPISENAIVGGAVGAAAVGMRPVAEVLFTDFLTTCMDPIVNQAAKLHYMSGGRVKVPLVVRMPSGGGIGMAAQHSQCLETMLVGVPGLTVIAPSDPHTAAGLLRAAIRSDNPVVFVEHKLLYMEVGPVPEAPAIVPLRKSRVVRRGRDITLVSYSYGVSRCRNAAEKLSALGVEAEIVDLLTLHPLDIMPVLRSIEKTRRLVAVDEDTLPLGMGAEVLARAAECAWRALAVPPRRLAGKEAPSPYCNALEQLMPPSVEDIVECCMEMISAH